MVAEMTPAVTFLRGLPAMARDEPVRVLPFHRVPSLRQRTVVLGAGVKAQRLLALLDDRRSPYELVGMVVPGPRVVRTSPTNRVIGTFDDLFQVVERDSVQSIVVALDDDEDELPTSTLFHLKTMGIAILDARQLEETLTGRIFIERTTPRHLIFSEGFRRPTSVLACKRASDTVAAIAGIVALAPLFAAVAVLIKLDSRGPVFYRQLRIGLHGRPFTIWKFRSMRVDAEQQHTPQWASASDPRITRIGRVLRSWRLDELPQLFNVLRGEMSLVGPRPERPIFVQELRSEYPYYDVRHTVLPGITGWAQVKFRYAASKEDSYQKLQYDLYYVKHMGLLLDVRIAIETMRVMLRGEGAR